MGIFVIREEIACVVRVIRIGEHNGIICTLSGNTNGRSVGHITNNGQRFPGLHGNVVCLVGHGVVLYHGIAADVQYALNFAVTGGVKIHRSAAAAGSVVFDRAAGKVECGRRPEHVHSAAVAGGFVAGDFAAGHIQGGQLLIQIDCAAVFFCFIPGDRAAGEVEGGLFAVHMHRSAFFGSRVIADLAAGHVQLTANAQINRTAVFGGIIVGNRAVGEGEGGSVQIHCAAVCFGFIPGDRAAGHVQHAAMVQTDRTAAVDSGFVAGNFAAEEIYGAAIDRINRAAELGTIVFDRAAVEIHSAALVALKRTIQEDRAGIAIGFVAGNFAAVHIKDTVNVVQCDGAAATVSSMAAGNFSAVHIHRTVMKVNSCSAPAAICAIDGAAARAVAEDEVRILPHLNLRGTAACKGLAVQAQIQRLSRFYFQVALDRDVIRQADIGGIIVTIIDGRGAVPRLIRHIRMGGVVTHSSIAAADAMGVRRCRVRRRGDRTGDGRGFADAIFGQLDRHREAAVRAALVGFAARYCRNHITNGDFAVAGGNVALPDFSGGPCGKRGLCVRLRHGDRKALRQRVDQSVDFRRNADMGVHTVVSVIVLRCKLLHAIELGADSLVELLRICAGKYYFGNAVQHRTTVFIAVLCVEDCLRRQKRNCVTIRKARRILCTHSQADVAVECKRSHINPIF